MTQKFSPDELLDMRIAQEEHMLDTGCIQTMTSSPNSFGQYIESFTDGEDIPLGLNMEPGSERRGDDTTITTYSAIARLPITATPNVGDRLKVTKRFGETLTTPIIFEIISPIQRGPSGIRILLQKVNI